MSDQQNPPADGKPERPESAPPPAETTTVLPAEGGPARRSAPRRFVAHRATQLVAAGLIGALIGGGAVALLDDDRRFDDIPDRSAFRSGDRFDDGGPWRQGPMRRIPQHHHDENGNVVPGPAPEN